MKKIICLLALLMLFCTACEKDDVSKNNDNTAPSSTTGAQATENTSSTDSVSATDNITDAPETTDAPDVTEAPDATEVADETEIPESTETPAITEAPVVTKAPVETAAPTEVHKHSFSNATCTAPKTCACGATEGASLGHNYSNGACARCGEADPNAPVTLSSEESYGKYVLYLPLDDIDMLDVYTLNWNGESSVTFEAASYYLCLGGSYDFVYGGKHYYDKTEMFDMEAQNVTVTEDTLSFELVFEYYTSTYTLKYQDGKFVVVSATETYVSANNVFNKE